MTPRTVADVLDATETGPFQRRLLGLTGAIQSVTALEILAISFVMPVFVETWSLSGLWTGLLGSATLIGMAVGMSAGGWYADRTGRVAALQWSVVGFSACSALTALAVGPLSAFAFRLLTGLFVGACLSVNVSYLTEHLPASDRGAYLVYLEAFWPVGTLLVVGIAWLVLVALAGDGRIGGIAAWRVLFVLTALPGLLVPLLNRWLGESPYYLAGSGRLGAANERLDRIARANGAGAVPRATAGVDEGGSARFARLFEPGLRARTALVSLLWFGLNFGYYGIFIWLPTILEGSAFSGSVYWQLFLVGLVQLPGVLSSAVLVDRVGRRPVIGWYLATAGVFMAVFADALGESTFTAVLPVSPLVALFLASFFLIGAWGPMFAYTTEVFPTNVRGTGFGFASSVGKIASIVGPIVVGLLVTFGFRVALAPFGVLLLAAGGVVLLFGPETKDAALG